MKITKKNEYYYLGYSYKENKKSKTIEWYLGKTIPKNILMLKNDFLIEIFEKKFGEKIKLIKENFNKEFDSFPKLEQEKYLKDFSIKFTYNSEAIEGGTLSLKDTISLLRDDISPNKKNKDIIESKKHYEVFLELLNSNKKFDLDFILKIHKDLFDQTYKEISGKLRNHEVRVLGSETIFTHPRKLKSELEDFFKWYNKNKNKINPFILAILSKFRFVSIHPFTDGNGRVSRIIMNYILYKNNLPLINIEYVKRNEYYNSLEKSNVKNNEFYFLDFLSKKFIKEHKKYLK